MRHFDRFFNAYVEAALFTTSDGSDESGGVPLDKNYAVADIAPSTLREMRRDAEAFVKSAEHDDLLHGAGDYERAGHDFWLTRNGHGAGFWDGDWPKLQGERLDALTRTFRGGYDLYVGDDGKIHGS